VGISYLIILQNNDFRIDLKDSPTNHNDIITLVMHLFCSQRGGIAFLLIISKLVCSLINNFKNPK